MMFTNIMYSNSETIACIVRLLHILVVWIVIWTSVVCLVCSTGFWSRVISFVSMWVSSAWYQPNKYLVLIIYLFDSTSRCKPSVHNLPSHLKWSRHLAFSRTQCSGTWSRAVSCCPARACSFKVFQFQGLCHNARAGFSRSHNFSHPLRLGQRRLIKALMITLTGTWLTGRSGKWQGLASIVHLLEPCWCTPGPPESDWDSSVTNCKVYCNDKYLT